MSSPDIIYYQFLVMTCNYRYLINNEEYILQIPADILLPMWLSHIFSVTRSGDAYPVHVSALPRVPGAKHEASGNNNNNNTLGVFIFNI